MAWRAWMRSCGWKAAWRSDARWPWRPGPPRCTADSWKLDLDRHQTIIAASSKDELGAVTGVDLPMLCCRRSPK